MNNIQSPGKVLQEIEQVSEISRERMRNATSEQLSSKPSELNWRTPEEEARIKELKSLLPEFELSRLEAKERMRESVSSYGSAPIHS